MPDGPAGLPLVGEHRDLGDAALVAAFGERHFGNGRRHALQRHELRHVGRRNAEQQIVAIGAHGSGAGFDDEVGLVAGVAQDAAAG